MTGQLQIDYEALAQEAKLGIVRKVLERVVKHGLPGDHHFYIAFDTQAPGVVISKRLKEKYAEEMTIVLQHRFWGLQVDDKGFEVKLTFGGITERLVVPYAAVKVFYDPSVPYGLQFEVPEGLGEGAHVETDGLAVGAADAEAMPRAAAPAPQRAGAPEQSQERQDRRRERAPRRQRSEVASRDGVIEAASDDVRGSQDVETPTVKPAPAPVQKALPAPAAQPAQVAADKPEATSEEVAKVVRLDAFRKK